MENNNFKHGIWASAIVIVIFIICVSAIQLGSHPMIMRFEIENSTQKLVEKVYDCNKNTTVLSKINVTNEELI